MEPVDNDPRRPSDEDQLCEMLLRYDEALASGGPGEALDSAASLAPELRERLRKGWEVLDLLHETYTVPVAALASPTVDAPPGRGAGAPPGELPPEANSPGANGHEANAPEAIPREASAHETNIAADAAGGSSPAAPVGPSPPGEAARAWLDAAAASPRSIGRFFLERELGRGGLGLVFLAYDPQLGRNVALKIPRPETLASADLRQRFLREAEAAARLSHPGIVTVYEVGEVGPCCYIAAEYCPGPTLAAWLAARREPVAARQAAQIVATLAEAVQHAHGRGVLHRDIKPSNVLLELSAAEEGGRPTTTQPAIFPKLGDFGTAKLLEYDPEETRPGTIIGTPEYMSPEQAQGRSAELDATTDVYALGTILYRLLAGQPPFRGATATATLFRVVFEEPLPPGRLRRDIPRDLEAICLKCLAKLPGDRYATAHGLAEDLGHFLAGRPTVARPLTPWQRLARWSRQRPAVSALAGSLLVLAAALFAVVLVYNRQLNTWYHRETAARRELQEQLDVNRRIIWAADVAKAWEGLQKNRGDGVRQFFARYSAPGDEPMMDTFAARLLRRHFDGGDHVLYHHQGAVYAAEFAPDGGATASAGADGRILVRDWASGDVLSVPRGGKAHDAEINCLVFSPDGAQLVSGGDDGLVRVWNRTSGEQIAELGGDVPERPAILGLAIAPDGGTLAVATASGMVRRFGTADYRALETPPLSHPAAVGDLSFSADGALLATACEDFHVRVWRMPEGTLWRDWDPGTRSKMGAVTFAHRSQLLVSADLQKSSVRFWDVVQDGQARIEEFGHTWIHSLAFSHDDRFLAYSNKDGAVGTFDLLQGRAGPTLFANAGCVWTVRFSPHDDQLLIGGADGSVRLLDFASLRRHHREKSFPAPPTDVAFASSASRPREPDLLAVRFANGLLQTTELATGAKRSELATTALSASDSLLALAPDGATAAFAVSGTPPRIVIANLATGELLRQCEGFASTVMSLAFSPDGSRLASGHQQGELYLWDVSTGAPIRSLASGQLSLYGVAFSPDGRRLATVGGNQLCLRDADSLSPLQTPIVLAGDTRCVAWQPGGPLVACNENDDLLLWNPASGHIDRLPAHEGDLCAIAFSSDGQTLATGGVGGTLWLWDIASRRNVAALESGAARVSCLAFSADGHSLAAGVLSRDGVNRLKTWHVARPDRGERDLGVIASGLAERGPPAAGAARRTSEDRAATTVYANDFDAAAVVAPGVQARLRGGKNFAASGFEGQGHPPHAIVGRMRRCAKGGIIRVELSDLPPHASVDVDFVLAVIDSWDGADNEDGEPDVWEVRVDGRPVFRESFSNRPLPGAQFYMPAAEVHVTAARRDNLGFGRHVDTIYDMRRESAFGGIPHSAATLVVEWQSLQQASSERTTESWALDNLEIVLHGSAAEDAAAGVKASH